MVIESLVAVALVGLVLSGLVEAHQSIAKLSATAKVLEARERESVALFFKDIPEDSSCTEISPIPLVLVQTCCEINVGPSDFKKKIKVCKLNSDSGQSVIGFLMALFFLALISAVSYPTLRQLLTERKDLDDSLSQNLSLKESFSEIERKIFDAQTIALPDVVQTLNVSDPFVKEAFNLANKNFIPRQDSSILLITEINIRALVYAHFLVPSANPNNIPFVTCGSLAGDTKLVAGFFFSNWKILKVIEQHDISLSNCVHATEIHLTSFNDEGVVSLKNLVGIAPISESQLYYLDSANNLRRYSLTLQRTTPVDYGYSKFKILTDKSQFHFEIVKKNKFKEKLLKFTTEIESPDPYAQHSLLF